MQESRPLWRQFIGGEPIGFEKLYLANFLAVRNFLRMYLGDRSAVDDITQDTFLQLWKRPDHFDPARSNVRAYLFGIARRKAADWWRQQSISNAVAPEISYHSESTLLITDALQHLEPDQRNILWLREIEGYSYTELASILDIPLGTVRSRLFTAREQLRRLWQTTSEE